VSLDPTSVAALEDAATLLLGLQSVRNRYDINDFWSLLASLIGTLPMDVPRLSIENRVSQLVEPGDTLVVIPVANVARVSSPVEIGNVIIAPFGTSFAEYLGLRLPLPATTGDDEPLWWCTREGAHDQNSPIVMAYRCQTQSNRALKEAESTFEDLVSIALALEPDLDAKQLFSLRGDQCRPGIRGLIPDRASVAEISQRSPELAKEFPSSAVLAGKLKQDVIHQWFGEDPFPLEELLKAPDRGTTTRELLTGDSVLCRRLRVAARWHAKAHWAFDYEDAVLALGIAFDAMLSEKGPSPGRALADRYALLHPDPAERSTRCREFSSEFYTARSAVAHGAKTKVDTDFVRYLARRIRWTLSRIWELGKLRNVHSDDDYEEMFATLKWGG
jgi:hypothetical protein